MNEITNGTGSNREYEVGYKKPPIASRFQNGNPGGPGAPKGSRSIASRLSELIELETLGGKPLPSGKQVADLVAESILKGCLKGDFRYAKELIDRVDGKVTDKIEHSGAIEITYVNDWREQGT